MPVVPSARVQGAQIAPPRTSGQTLRGGNPGSLPALRTPRNLPGGNRLARAIRATDNAIAENQRVANAVYDSTIAQGNRQLSDRISISRRALSDTIDLTSAQVQGTRQVAEARSRAMTGAAAANLQTAVAKGNADMDFVMGLMGHVVNAANTIDARIKSKRVKELENEFAKFMTDMSYGNPETGQQGYLTLQNDEAVDTHLHYRKQINDKYEELKKEADKAGVGDKFGTAALARMQNTMTAWSRHNSTQLKNSEYLVSAARQQQANDDAVMNPEFTPRSLEINEAEVRNQAANNGILDEEVIARMVRDAHTQTLSGVLDAQINNGRIDRASRILGIYQNLMDPIAKGKYISTLAGATQERMGWRVLDELREQHGTDFKSIEQAISELDDFTLQEAAYEAFDSFFTRINKMETRQTRLNKEVAGPDAWTEALSSIPGMVDKYGNVDQKLLIDALEQNKSKMSLSIKGMIKDNFIEMQKRANNLKLINEQKAFDKVIQKINEGVPREKVEAELHNEIDTIKSNAQLYETYRNSARNRAKGLVEADAPSEFNVALRDTLMASDDIMIYKTQHRIPWNLMTAQQQSEVRGKVNNVNQIFKDKNHVEFNSSLERLEALSGFKLKADTEEDVAENEIRAQRLNIFQEEFINVQHKYGKKITKISPELTEVVQRANARINLRIDVPRVVGGMEGYPSIVKEGVDLVQHLFQGAIAYTSGDVDIEDAHLKEIAIGDANPIQKANASVRLDKLRDRDVGYITKLIALGKKIKPEEVNYRDIEKVAGAMAVRDNKRFARLTSLPPAAADQILGTRPEYLSGVTDEELMARYPGVRPGIGHFNKLKVELKKMLGLQVSDTVTDALYQNPDVDPASLIDTDTSLSDKRPAGS